MGDPFYMSADDVIKACFRPFLRLISNDLQMNNFINDSSLKRQKAEEWKKMKKSS